MPADTAQNYHIEGLPFGTRGGMLIKHQFPADGEYTFNVKGVTGYFQAVLGRITGEQLEVTIDGERVKLFDWDKEIANTTGNGSATPRIPVKAGLHTVGVTFLATNDVPGTELNKPFQRTMNTPGDDPGLHVLSARRPGHDRRAVRREGRDRHGEPPQDLRRAGRPTPREEDACARTIVSTLAKRAFRRPVDGRGPRRSLMEFYQAGRERGRHASTTASRRRCSASSRIRSSSIAASASRRRWPRAGAIASATSRWPRGCRSSSGAASPTTS